MAGHGAKAEPALAAAVGLLLIGACGGSTNPQPTPSASRSPERATLKIAVGGQAQPAYMPLSLGISLGFFKAEGLSLEIQDQKGDAQALAALNEGSVDVAASLYEHTIRMQAQGKQVEMITVFDLDPGLVLFANAKHQDAKSIRDIAGAKIGVSAVGSPAEEMVKYLFKQNGLDPNAARTVAVGIGSPAQTALKNDVVQGLATMEPAASTIEQSGDGKVLYDTRTPPGTRTVFGGTYPAGGLYLTTEFAKQNPRTMAALARAVVKTLKYVHSHNADEIASALPAPVFYPDGNRAFFVQELQANLAMYSADGMMSADGPNDVLQTLKAADPKTDWSAVDLKKTYDDSYVKAAANVK